MARLWWVGAPSVEQESIEQAISARVPNAPGARGMRPSVDSGDRILGLGRDRQCAIAVRASQALLDPEGVLSMHFSP